MITEMDRLLAGPPEALAAFGVTPENQDLCRLTGEAAAAAERMQRLARAEKIIDAAGAMTVEEFRTAILDAAAILGGPDGR